MELIRVEEVSAAGRWVTPVSGRWHVIYLTSSSLLLLESYEKREYIVDRYQARYDAVVRAQQDERRAALTTALESNKRVSFMDRVKVALANMRKGK